MNLNRFISLARGEQPADLLLKNARLVNVLSGEIYPADVAVANGLVIGFGNYRARKSINLRGLYLAPGFIDGHIHIESSLLTPTEFAKAVLPNGTTAVVCDPHEIANVSGVSGIKYFLDANNHCPLSIFTMLPSCVPATHLETSGAELTARTLAKLRHHKSVLGLAEMMNYPGVLSRDKEVLKKLQLFARPQSVPYLCGDRIDGHAPLLTGKDLAAYIGAGIKSDHESTNLNEAREKLRAGMFIMVREGTAAKNMAALMPLLKSVNGRPACRSLGAGRRCIFVSDDRHPTDLLNHGHLDHTLRKAVRLGLNPVTAIRMVTLNPAEYFGLTRLGAIAPGYQADLVAFDNLKTFNVRKVFKNGRLVAQDGGNLAEYRQPIPRQLRSAIKIPQLSQNNLSIRVRSGTLKVIELIPNQIITRQLLETPLVRQGYAVADVKRDILKLVVVERHKASGKTGLGFVKGFGLKNGAIASSVAHDSHNIIAVGADDADILTAVRHIKQLGGGYAVTRAGKIIASLALPIGGLMSDRPLREIALKVGLLNKATQQLGCRVKDPFMALSFLALPVIPELKLTDKGLVDVKQFKIVPLFGATDYTD
ncbi:MAG: adenine deaminase [Planctomycetes bacterium]|nr:adenine deaminase [Planctomycetota bacterium]